MPRPDRPELHLVTDARLPRPALLRAVGAAAANGVDWVQVRDHRAPSRELFDLVQEVVGLCRPLGVRVAVSDRLDVALAAGTDGVQLGGESLPVEAARRVATGLLVGVSVHRAEDAARAAAAGADWVTFGHVFPTASHPGETPRGLAELARVVQAVGIPVIAIGGIGPSQVAAAITAGASGVAVISAILDAPDPTRAAAELRWALAESARQWR